MAMTTPSLLHSHTHSPCSLVFTREPHPPRLRVQVKETEYQPINTRTSRKNKAQVLVAVKHSVEEGRGRSSGSPSLLWVLVKTNGLQFIVSIFYKLCYDIMDFANPLILK